MNHNTTIRYVFQKQQIRDLKVRAFVEAFDISEIPDAALGSYCDSLRLELDIDKQERRQPYLIPEVRSFCRRLEQLWPHAAFFCELWTPFLLIHTLSQFDYLAVLERANEPHVWAHYKTAELTAALERGRTHIRELGQRASMTQTQIVRRQTGYSDYMLSRLGGKWIK
jgi:hypothetical protein